MRIEESPKIEVTQTEEQVPVPAPVPMSKKKLAVGVLVFVLAVAAVVVAGILPRLKSLAALTVTVVQPKVGAPAQEIVLPSNMQAFTDSPIYARTNGYLRHWYVDIGARVKTSELMADIETPEVDEQLQQVRRPGHGPRKSAAL